MENENFSASQFVSSIQNPPPTNSDLENTNSDNNNNIAPNAMVALGADVTALDVVAGAKSEGASLEVVMKRGRGRPRKYGDNGNLMMSSMLTPPGFSTRPLVSTEKRSRGRPRGSGKLEALASIGGFVAESARGGFTPHMVIVKTGEDAVSTILSFFQTGPRAACILSAVGAVSSVVIRQPNASYEGHFEIVSLSGSSTYTSGIGGEHGKNGMLTVSLAKPDGMVFGGVIESMIAAIPIQLVMATFKQNIGMQIKRKHLSESLTTPNVPSDHHLKVPKLMEGEQSCPQTLKPNGEQDNVIPVTTIGVEGNVILEDLNMHFAPVNGVGLVGLDNQTMQPIPDPRKLADVDANVP